MFVNKAYRNWLSSVKRYCTVRVVHFLFACFSLNATSFWPLQNIITALFMAFLNWKINKWWWSANRPKKEKRLTVSRKWWTQMNFNCSRDFQLLFERSGSAKCSSANNNNKKVHNLHTLCNNCIKNAHWNSKTDDLHKTLSGMQNKSSSNKLTRKASKFARWRWATVYRLNQCLLCIFFILVIFIEWISCTPSHHI